MGHPRKQKAARKRCEACGHKAIYPDIISAQVDAMYSNQTVVRCPQNTASHWDKHPVDHKDAVHIEHLAVDSTRADLGRALHAWTQAMDQLAATQEPTPPEETHGSH